MLYYDIHTHHPPVHPEDIAIVNVTVGREGLESLRKEIRENPAGCSAGIHPWYIYNVHAQIETLRSLLEENTLVAIGEAGLDKMADAPLSLQQEVFLEQARMAEEYRKPLIIHCVKAWQELIAVKKLIRPGMPWIIHGFRGNGELAAQLIAQGFYLSFGAAFNPAALKAAWPHHLLAETDDRKIDIRTVYSLISTSLSVSEEELALQIESQLKSRIFAGKVGDSYSL